MKMLPWLLGGLWLFGVLQAGAAPHMYVQLSVFGATPDFLLIFSLVFSTALSRPGATALGFGAGLITGGLVAANLTHYIVSRTFTCFLASWSRRLRFELSYPTIATTVFLGTLIARILFMFTAAPRDVGLFLRDTIAEATYNGVLALPLYSLVKRVLPSPSRRRI